MGFGQGGVSPIANGQASTEVTSSSGEDSPSFKDQLLGLKVERTETLVQTWQLLDVKEAFRDKHGVEVTDALLVSSDEPVNKICCIPVKEGVRWWNLMAIPLIPCIIMLLSTYVNAQTILLLRNDEFFDINEDKLGRISSTLVLAGLPVAMFATFSAGYLFDTVGRRITLFCTFFFGSGFVLIIPYTSPNVFPSLYLVRMLITLCLTAPSANPLLADYVHKDAIGKAAALVGLGFVIGEVLAMGVLFNVTSEMTPYTAFLVVSIVGACCSTLFIFLVKEPKLRSSGPN